ncbi:hypothetical protein [Jatrophihabitans sp.]|uniref:hypothetical protein n=1 Tax=Jatrophihabitans sp. TaxID=1932789 RepID=UPI002B93FC92|nr:hypothetical protein [Jatrophihabitans sp.]
MCEGADLQRLLEEVNAQPGAQILYQDRVRRGGVCGFFAREVHRIAYRVADTEAATDDAATPVDSLPAESTLPAEPVLPAVDVAGSSPAAELYAGAPAAGLPSGTELPELDELLATAEAAENAGGGQHRAPDLVRQPLAGQPAGQPDFAALLRTLTEADSDSSLLAVARTDSAPAGNAPLGSAPLGSAPAGIERPVRPAKPIHSNNVTAIGKPDARARLEMLMQLRQVGVPVSVNPRTDTHTLYEALESILDDLPAPAVPPRGAGEVLAVVGESGPALQAARTCAAMLRIPPDGIGVAGLAGSAEAGTDYPVISGRAEALRLRTELRRADLPSIVVIATDATVAGPDDPWAAEMLAALCPTAVWAVVDARWKTEDSRAQLDRLGQVDALVVHSAQLSASPASVWDLDLPLGLLDGRAASTFAWAGLLFPLLRGGARHRASA